MLLRGAITGVTRLLFAEPPLLSADSRARAEGALISAAENVLRTPDPQTGNNMPVLACSPYASLQFAASQCAAAFATAQRLWGRNGVC